MNDPEIIKLSHWRKIKILPSSRRANDTDLCDICGGVNDCVGCMEDAAFNYNPDATIGSECIYK